MPPLSRQGDLVSGHDDCSETTIDGFRISNNVKALGQWAAREGDSCGSHGCEGHITHFRKIKKGTTKVKINGEGAARVGSPVEVDISRGPSEFCGGVVAQGARTVIVGG